MNILFVVKKSALNRGLSTGLENLAWALSNYCDNIFILSGGMSPKTVKLNPPKNVRYYFSGHEIVSPLEYTPYFRDITNKNNINVVIGWVENIAHLASLKTELQQPVFIANEGNLNAKNVYIKYLYRMLQRKTSLLEMLKMQSSLFFANKNIHRVVNISSSVEKSSIKYYRFKRTKSSVIHRGIDTKIFKKTNKNKAIAPSILFTGDINKNKGITDLVNSFRYIDRSVNLELCGTADSNYIDYLKRKLQKHSPESTLNYRGKLTALELVDYYNYCDIFFFCSHSEGLGKSLLEAMSCKCPPICSDIDTFKEVIKDRHNGLIVPVKNSKKIAEAINLYLNDSNLKELISENCRRTIEEHYSKESEIFKWLNILEYETNTKYSKN